MTQLVNIHKDKNVIQPSPYHFPYVSNCKDHRFINPSEGDFQRTEAYCGNCIYGERCDLMLLFLLTEARG